MNSKKLTHVHVYIIGAVLAVIVGVGLFYFLLKPLDEKNKSLRGDISTTESSPVQVAKASFNINQKTQADKALVDEKATQAKMQSELDQKERVRRLPSNINIVIPSEGPDLATTLPRWLVLAPQVVRQMTAYAQTTAKKYDVKVTTSFAAPAPSTDLSTIPTDIIAWNLGPITATGPFPKVMAWAREWNRSPLLTSVDGLKCSIAGPKGVVTANASITAYFFPTGPGVKEAGAGAPAGGGGGMTGMPGMTGMSGYPGGVPGGVGAMPAGNGVGR
jgi:hypothetical protein